MRRLVIGIIFALTIGFLVGSRLVPSPSSPVVLERTRVEPRMAVAIPAALRRHADLEFGYVDQDR